MLLGAAAALAVARSAAGAWLIAAQPEEIPLDGDQTGWRVRATLNGTTRATFLVDTGASLCVLSPALAHRAGARRPVGHVELRTANGIIRAPIVRVRSLDVGGAKAMDLDCVVHAAAAEPIEGVLGLNYLNQFAYGIDPRRRTLSLR